MGDGGQAKEFVGEFAAGRLPRDRFRLLGARGRERLSRLFEVDFVVACEGGALTSAEIDDLFQTPCALTLGPSKDDVVRGVVERVRRVDPTRTNTARYVVRMMPTAYLLTLARTNRIFQSLSVPEIVASILSLYGLAHDRDFRLSIQDHHRKREYVVEYDESDWDFIQRWLEHDGLYYWFEHGGDGERLVISDSNQDATPIGAPSAIAFRERSALATEGEATIWDWESEERRIPARTVLVDYNYRTPGARLVAKAAADEKRGFGTAMSYGEHFKNTDEGTALAKLRAQRLLCEQRTHFGTTDCSRFRVGHRFELDDAPLSRAAHAAREPGRSGAYLITSIDWEIGVSLDEPHENSSAKSRSYEARFEALPISLQFRPERRTPWPSIHGVMQGHIAADGSGKYAEIDEQGRYKVCLPLDSGPGPGASSSRWIRMAQHYSGPGYGSHYPLHRGTEVLLAHVDGDPDRPVIIASVPNTHTVSPSTKVNATQSVTQTASGIRVELEDRAEQSKVKGAGAS
jgi:type VI secretion system secreted protein VgrG